MIKSTECRIGNLVTGSLSGTWEALTGDDIKRMEECEQAGKLHGKQPILLTPEVLERCGFRKDTSRTGGQTILENGPFEIELFPSGEWWIFGLEDFKPPIKHLHQMQNLYYALTGEELKVSLIPA